MNKKLRVFVSTICTEVIEEYQFAIKTIHNLGHVPLTLEPSNDISDKHHVMLNCMDISNAYILILGGQYASNKSDLWIDYMESEYSRASYMDLPILVIIIDDNYLSAKSNPQTTIQIFNNDSNSFNNFAPLVATLFTVVFPAKNLSDIRVAIKWFLNVICEMGPLQNSRGRLTAMLYHRPTPNQKQSEFPFISINPKDLKQYKKIDYYYDPAENINIKSLPDITVKECIIDPLGNPISDIDNIHVRTDICEINDWMLNDLKKNPTKLYQLSSREFEKLIAKIFIKKGYSVELTPATRDNGRDILVAKNDIISFLFFVECKKYSPDRPVGIEVIQRLFGVISAEKATGGIIATTSYFSKPARDYIQEQHLEHKITLQDYNVITNLLESL